MVLFGFAWFLSALHFSNSPLLYSVALVAGGLWGGLFLQLVMAFPSGRLAPGRDRAPGHRRLPDLHVRLDPAHAVRGTARARLRRLPDERAARSPRRRSRDRRSRLRVAALPRPVRDRARPPTAALAAHAAARAPAAHAGLRLRPAHLPARDRRHGGRGRRAWWAAFSATALLPFAFLGGLLRSHVARLDAELRPRVEELRASRARLVEAERHRAPAPRAQPARRRAGAARGPRAAARPSRAGASTPTRGDRGAARPRAWTS
jgi:hypothetical protein